MTMRNVESRLIKLEARRQRPHEILLIWRWPDADVKAATNGARFAPGDRVICLEWFGDGPLPAPRWYRDRLTSEFGVTEKESLDRSLDSVGEDGRQRDPGFADIPHVPARRLRELPDNDLLHMIFGIGTCRLPSNACSKADEKPPAATADLEERINRLEGMATK